MTRYNVISSDTLNMIGASVLGVSLFCVTHAVYGDTAYDANADPDASSETTFKLPDNHSYPDSHGYSADHGSAVTDHETYTEGTTASGRALGADSAFLRLPSHTYHTNDVPKGGIGPLEGGESYNNTTPGMMFGLKWDDAFSGDLKASFGFVRNSFENTSPVVSAEWYPNSLDFDVGSLNIKPGAGAGGIYYSEALEKSDYVIGDGFLPMGGLSVQFNTDSRIGGFINYVPGELVNRDLSSLVIIGVEISLGERSADNGPDTSSFNDHHINREPRLRP